MAWLWGGGKAKRAGEAQQRTTLEAQTDAVPRRAATLEAHTSGVKCCGCMVAVGEAAGVGVL